MLHRGAGFFKAGHSIVGRRKRVEVGEIIDLPSTAAVAHVQGESILAQIIAGMLKALADGKLVCRREHLRQILAAVAVYLSRALGRVDKPCKLRLHLRLDAVGQRGGVQIGDLDLGSGRAEALPRVAGYDGTEIFKGRAAYQPGVSGLLDGGERLFERRTGRVGWPENKKCGGQCNDNKCGCDNKRKFSFSHEYSPKYISLFIMNKFYTVHQKTSSAELVKCGE